MQLEEFWGKNVKSMEVGADSKGKAPIISLETQQAMIFLAVIQLHQAKLNVLDGGGVVDGVSSVIRYHYSYLDILRRLENELPLKLYTTGSLVTYLFCTWGQQQSQALIRFLLQNRWRIKEIEELSVMLVNQLKDVVFN